MPGLFAHIASGHGHDRRGTLNHDPRANDDQKYHGDQRSGSVQCFARRRVSPLAMRIHGRLLHNQSLTSDAGDRAHQASLSNVEMNFSSRSNIFVSAASMAFIEMLSFWKPSSLPSESPSSFSISPSPPNSIKNLGGATRS